MAKIRVSQVFEVPDTEVESKLKEFQGMGIEKAERVSMSPSFKDMLFLCLMFVALAFAIVVITSVVAADLVNP